MSKSPDAFRSIGEVARLLGVATHVLRYWETQFPALAPVKRADGRRYYRPEDVRLAAGLCEVLRDDGLTIRGANKLIASDRGEGLRRRGAERLERTDAAAPRPEPAARSSSAARKTRRSTAGGAVEARAVPAAGRHRLSAAPRDDAGEASAAVAVLEPPISKMASAPEPSVPGRDAGGTPAPSAWLGRLAATACALRMVQQADPALLALARRIVALR